MKELPRLPRYTLKQVVSGKELYLSQIGGDGSTYWQRGLHACTMFTKETLIELKQKNPDIKGCIVRNGSVPDISSLIPTTPQEKK